MLKIDEKGPVWQLDDVSIHAESAAYVSYWNESGIERSCVACPQHGWRIEAKAAKGAGAWQISNDALGLAFSLKLSLSGEELVLAIPRESVKESGKCKLKSIRPFPGWCSGQEGDGGALILPFEEGALCRHSGHAPGEHNLPGFFPWDLSLCSLSMFGVDNGRGQTLAAIIEGGKFDFGLQVRTCWGERKIYAVDAYFAFRDHAKDTLLDETPSIHYRLLTGKDSGYIGLAKHYRRHQTTRRNLPTLAQKLEGNPVLQHSLRSPSVRCRMAVKQMPTPILEQTRDNQPPLKVFLTFANIRTIMEECARQQTGPLEFCLVGWNYGGHDGAFPQLFPVEPQLGGEAELRKTIARAKELGYPLSLHDNYLDAYSLAENFDPESLIRQANGQPVKVGQYGGGQAYQVCAKCAYEQNVLTSLPRVAGLGISGPYFVDVVSILALEKCYHPAHPLTRRGTAEWRKKIIQFQHTQCGASYSEGARDWTLPELDRAYCLGHLEGVSVPYLDEKIPLYPLAYHGYLIYNTFRGGVNAFPGEEIYLRNLAYGGLPILYFHCIFNPGWSSAEGWDKDLTFTSPEKLKVDVARIKRVTDDVARVTALQTETIADYQQLAPALTQTTFENGARIIANYSDKPVKFEGLEILPRDFVVCQPARSLASVQINQETDAATCGAGSAASKS